MFGNKLLGRAAQRAQSTQGGAAPSGAMRAAGRAIGGRPMQMADGGKVSKGKVYHSKQISMRKG
jgi:hypothetical protein